MHVLVTGAGGFSGSEITRALLGRGHRVTACIGNSRGRLTKEIEVSGQVDIISGDLAGDLNFPEKIDAIVHAAARSPEPGVTIDALVKDNVIATRRLARYARSVNVKRFVYLSSLSVYGRIETPVASEATLV